MAGDGSALQGGTARGPGETWDAVAAGYAAYWSPRFVPYLRRAVELVRPGPRGPLAVPGCGPGEEVILLHRRFPERVIVATDPSAAMLALLRARLRQEGIGRALTSQGTAESLTGSVLEAAAVLSCFTLQFLPRPLEALADWARALALGGTATALFWPRPAPASAFGRLSAAIESTLGESRPEWEPGVRRELPQLGLQLVHEESLAHEIGHASASELFDRLVDAGPFRALLERHGQAALERCRAAWLRDTGLETRGARVVDRPQATLWVLEASGARGGAH